MTGPRTNITQPLILTLKTDPTTQTLLTTLRTRHFPRHRNHLSAHITLFHALPAASLPLYTSLLSTLTRTTPAFPIGLGSAFLLGRTGVGINIESEKLRALHGELLRALRSALGEEKAKGEGEGRLTRQDCQTLRPHVTVQNKVGEEEARRTLEALRAGEYVEGEGRALGFGLWRYERSGEWTHLKDFDFEGKQDGVGYGKVMAGAVAS